MENHRNSKKKLKIVTTHIHIRGLQREQFLKNNCNSKKKLPRLLITMIHIHLIQLENF